MIGSYGGKKSSLRPVHEWKKKNQWFKFFKEVENQPFVRDASYLSISELPVTTQ